jgi:ParB/RepB/Spo0J family partition protein
MEPAVSSIRLDQIKPSGTNVRKHFDQAQLEELTKSVREHGVLQPVLVRPNGQGYQLVAGERRWKAAQAAGLAEIPALVRQLGDAEVVEAQLVENLQREDLPPLEEAEGYEALLKANPKLTVDDLVAKVGKSKTYVYGRLKLAALVEMPRQALREGKITAAVAFLLARLPGPVQPAATKRILEGEGYGRDKEPFTTNAARQLIERQFMLLLKEAPFPKDRADLVAGAGTCQDCPKRTGNQKELFADASSGDLCTDPGCFENKRRAWVAVRLEQAKKAGATIVTGEKAKKIIPYAYPNSVNVARGYVNLDDHCYEDAKHRTYRQLAGKDVQPTVVQLQDRLVEVLPESDLKKIPAIAEIRKRRHQASSGGSSSSGTRPDWKKREQQEAARRKVKKAAALEALKQVVDQAAAGTASRTLELLAYDLVVGTYDVPPEWVREHHALPKRDKDLPAALAKFNLQRLQALVIEAHLAGSIEDLYADFPDELKRACAAYKVDLRACEATAAAKAKASPEPKCRKCGCTEEKACKGGCSWVEKPDPKTGLGLCSSCSRSIDVERVKAAQKAAAGPLARKKRAKGKAA